MNLKNNSIYIELLTNFNGKKMPSYIELARRVGITRQTASKKVKELIDNQIVTIMNDKTILVQDVLYDEFMADSKSVEKLMEENGELFNRYFQNYEEQPGENVNKAIIYGIISEGIIKYVGSTQNYQHRREQHIQKRPYLTFGNFVILQEVPAKYKLFSEKRLIKILNPEWNIMSKE